MEGPRYACLSLNCCLAISGAQQVRAGVWSVSPMVAYLTQGCAHLRWPTSAAVCRAPFIAFKTEASGDVGASSVVASQVVMQATNTDSNQTVQAKALVSGYVFYQDANAPAIGKQTPAPGAATFTRLGDCEAACSEDNRVSSTVCLQ
jgi:hypothetical protein